MDFVLLVTETFNRSSVCAVRIRDDKEAVILVVADTLCNDAIIVGRKIKVFPVLGQRYLLVVGEIVKDVGAVRVIDDRFVGGVAPGDGIDVEKCLVAHWNGLAIGGDAIKTAVFRIVAADLSVLSHRDGASRSGTENAGAWSCPDSFCNRWNKARPWLRQSTLTWRCCCCAGRSAGAGGWERSARNNRTGRGYDRCDRYAEEDPVNTEGYRDNDKKKAYDQKGTLQAFIHARIIA